MWTYMVCGIDIRLDCAGHLVAAQNTYTDFTYRIPHLSAFMYIYPYIHVYIYVYIYILYVYMSYIVYDIDTYDLAGASTARACLSLRRRYTLNLTGKDCHSQILALAWAIFRWKSLQPFKLFWIQVGHRVSSIVYRQFFLVPWILHFEPSLDALSLRPNVISSMKIHSCGLSDTRVCAPKLSDTRVYAPYIRARLGTGLGRALFQLCGLGIYRTVTVRLWPWLEPFCRSKSL